MTAAAAWRDLRAPGLGSSLCRARTAGGRRSLGAQARPPVTTGPSLPDLRRPGPATPVEPCMQSRSTRGAVVPPSLVHLQGQVVSWDREEGGRTRTRSGSASARSSWHAGRTTGLEAGGPTAPAAASSWRGVSEPPTGRSGGTGTWWDLTQGSRTITPHKPGNRRAKQDPTRSDAATRARRHGVAGSIWVARGGQPGLYTALSLGSARGGPGSARTGGLGASAGPGRPPPQDAYTAAFSASGGTEPSRPLSL